MNNVYRGIQRALLAALVVGSVWGCSGDTLPAPGELMVAVTTDMALPKDFDTIHLEVLTNGQTQFANDYAVGPDGLRTPATIGLIAGKNSSIPTHIRVIARQGGEHGTARVLREAVVTVPTDRLAMLQLSVGWLCNGSAKEPAPGEVVNADCSDGQTCIAGSCAKAAIDASDLPDYDAKAVFGGGTEAGGGECFDTLGCFAQARSATVDRASCTIDKPSGQVNVALVTGLGGDGICSASTCLVPLDAESPEGWQTIGKRIQLPNAVCGRLASGSVLNVAATNDCAAKAASVPPCGPWSSVSTAAPPLDGAGGAPGEGGAPSEAGAGGAPSPGAGGVPSPPNGLGGASDGGATDVASDGGDGAGVEANCGNGKRDGAEVGIDCGGVCANTCANPSVAVAEGGEVTCALLHTGAVKCWGYGYGIGAGDTQNRGDGQGEMGDALREIDLGSGRTATQISVGEWHSCAVLDNSDLKCWGGEGTGEVGSGDTPGTTPGSMGDALPPVALGTGRSARVVSAGQAFTCAILDDGRVKCWGSNGEGELGIGDTADRGDDLGEMGDSLPFVNLGTGRTAVTLATGFYHACAVLDNGQLKCWGSNANAQLGLGDTIARGNAPNQMGDNLPAVSLGTGRKAVGVVAGEYYTCALLDDATVKCWGYSQHGALGTGNTLTIGGAPAEMGDGLAPVNLGASRTAISISGGRNAVCALLDDGNLKCWGLNTSGLLGLGDVNNRGDSPGEMGDALPSVALGTGRRAVQVATGEADVCVVLDTEQIACWGWNNFGEAGLGDNQMRGDSPDEMGDNLRVVPLGSPNQTVSTGNVFTCATLTSGAVKCWGYNNEGELGLGDQVARSQLGDALPKLDLGAGRTARQLVAGVAHTCALLDNGTVKCWGQNNAGQLGLGNTTRHGQAAGDMGDLLPAVDLGAGVSVVSLKAGAESNCALLAGGAVKCWGDNTFGGLGLGDADPRGDGPGELGDALLPVDLGTNQLAISIATGARHTCALLSAGGIKCWGDDTHGQLGYGDVVDRGALPGEMGENLLFVNLGSAGRAAVAIAAGAQHTCALRDDGQVKCWGDNSFGQLGLGDIFDRGDDVAEMGDALPLVDLGNGRFATAIAAGAYQTCALLDNRALKCWGYNGDGELGLGDTNPRGDNQAEMGDALPSIDLGTNRTARSVAITLEGYPSPQSAHICARLDHGALKCWGTNSYGELGTGDGQAHGDAAGELGDALPPLDLGM